MLFFAARETHEAVPQTPDSRQSFAAEMVAGDSAFGNAVHLFPICASQSDGSLHLRFEDLASVQKSGEDASDDLLLQPPIATARIASTTMKSATTREVADGADVIRPAAV